MADRLTDLGDNMERKRSANTRRVNKGKPAGAGPTTGKTRLSGASRTPTNDARAGAARGSAQARTAERVAASGGGRAGQIAQASKASRIAQLGKGTLKVAKSPALLALGSYAGGLDSYNTPTSEQAKLLGVEEGAPSPDQSVGQQIGGFAKDTAIRSAGTGYQTAQNMGLVALADAVIPGSNLPRFDHGKYVPGDQVDETTFGDVAGGALGYLGKGAGAVNDAYRYVAGYDDQYGGKPTPAEIEKANAAQAQQAAADPNSNYAGQAIARATDIGQLPEVQARPDTPPAEPGQAVAQPRAQAGQPQNNAIYESRGANGERRFSDTGGGTRVEQGAPEAPTSRLTTYDGQATTRAYQDATAIRNQTADRQSQQRRELADFRRQRSADEYANRLASERSQAISDIKGSVAYRSSNDPNHDQAIQNLAALTGNTQSGVGQDVRGAPATPVDPNQQALTRAQAENQQLQVAEARRQQEMQEQYRALAATDPQLAQQFAQANGLGAGAGGEIQTVEGQEVIFNRPDGEPLLEPVTIDRNYDARTGQAIGGPPARQAPQAQPVSKAEFVRLASQVPSNKNKTTAQLEAEYARLLRDNPQELVRGQ